MAPPWPQRLVLAAALVALLVVAVVAPAPDAAERGLAEPSPVDSAPPLVAVALERALSAVAGERAPAILGALMLALAGALACRPLERRIGPEGPILVALAAFGSAAWALVWTDGTALAALALAAAAFALVYGGGSEGEAPAEVYRAPQAGASAVVRWAAAGVLLAELAPVSPLLAGLLLPAGLAAPPRRRRVLLPSLGAGFAATLVLELAVRGAGWATGPAAVAAATVSLDPALAGQSLLAVVAGRNVGLLAGFAPLLLLLALGRGGRGRPALAAVGLALPLLAALLLPFDFAAGWLNLSFVAVYGALWHLPARPPRGWEWAATALLAALATWPLWVSPRAALAGDGAGLAAAWPRRHLPYELVLRRPPHHGEAEIVGGVRVRAVAGCRLRGGSGRFELDGAGPAAIWLATPPGLERVGLELGPGAPSSFEVVGGGAGRTVFRPDGRVGFEVLLSAPRVTGRLWLGEAPRAVHLIEVRFGEAEGVGPLRFRLLAAPQP